MSTTTTTASTDQEPHASTGSSLRDRLAPLANAFKKHPKIAVPATAVVLIAALALTFSGGGEGEVRQFHTVEPGPFLVSITEGGNLEAVDEVVVRNELEGSSRIIYIIPEGSMVKKGDLLVELDAGEADDALNQQQITYEKSVADHIAAQNNLVITKSTVESEVRAAELAVQFAKMDLDKFSELDRAQQMRSAEIEIIKAQEELQIAEEALENTKKLQAKGFETKRQLDQDELTVTTRRLTLEEAENFLKMLETYDLEKLRAQFQSDHEEALKNLERVKKQGESLVAQAEADLNSAKNTLELNRSKLEKMKEQFSATKLYAPQDGLVVYAISDGRFSNESMVEEGATVRMRQELIKIPDTSKMKLSIKVHESQVAQVEEGQPAFVVLDSMPDERFRGTVKKVAVLPDSQSRWGNPNLKVYTTEIEITDPLPENVKPGVSARAEIVITRLEDALTVPIQSVTTFNGEQVCYVDQIGGPGPVPVEVGLYNNHFIEVTEGLEPGDRILIAPPIVADTEIDSDIVGDDEQGLDLPSQRPQPEAGRDQGEGRSRQRGQDDGGQDRGDQDRGGSPQGGDSQSGTPGVSPSEEQRAQAIKRFDKDGDGKLSDEERSAMINSFQRGGGSEDRGT